MICHRTIAILGAVASLAAAKPVHDITYTTPAAYGEPSPAPIPPYPSRGTSEPTFKPEDPVVAPGNKHRTVLLCESPSLVVCRPVIRKHAQAIFVEEQHSTLIGKASDWGFDHGYSGGFSDPSSSSPASSSASASASASASSSSSGSSKISKRSHSSPPGYSYGGSHGSYSPPASGHAQAEFATVDKQFAREDQEEQVDLACFRITLELWSGWKNQHAAAVAHSRSSSYSSPGYGGSQGSDGRSGSGFGSDSWGYDQSRGWHMKNYNGASEIVIEEIRQRIRCHSFGSSQGIATSWDSSSSASASASASASSASDSIVIGSLDVPLTGVSSSAASSAASAASSSGDSSSAAGASAAAGSSSSGDSSSAAGASAAASASSSSSGSVHSSGPSRKGHSGVAAENRVECFVLHDETFFNVQRGSRIWSASDSRSSSSASASASASASSSSSSSDASAAAAASADSASSSFSKRSHGGFDWMSSKDEIEPLVSEIDIFIGNSGLGSSGHGDSWGWSSNSHWFEFDCVRLVLGDSSSIGVSRASEYSSVSSGSGSGSSSPSTSSSQIAAAVQPSSAPVSRSSSIAAIVAFAVAAATLLM